MAEIETIHSQRCTHRRKAELAKEAAEAAAVAASLLPPAQGHATSQQQEQKPAVLPTPPISTEPSSPAPAAVSSSQQADPSMLASQTSDTSTLTALTVLSEQERIQAALQGEMVQQVKTEPVEHEDAVRPLSAVEARKEDQPAMASGSGTRHVQAALQEDTVIMDSAPGSPAATIDDVRNAFEEVSAAIAHQQSASTSRSPSPVDVRSSLRDIPEAVSSKVLFNVSLQRRPQIAKPPLKRPHTPAPTAPSTESSADPAISEPSSPSTPSHASNEVPYSPSRDVDDTVWSMPQPKPSKRPRRSGNHVANEDTTKSSSRSQTVEAHQPPKKEKRKDRPIEAASKTKSKPTAPTPSRADKQTNRRQSFSPEIVVAASLAGPTGREAGSSSKKRRRVSPSAGENKKKHLIKSWTASIAASAPPDHRPPLGPAVQDKALATIPAFPPRVLARFHSLGVESTGDLTRRGVMKEDYSALLKHLMTLPERPVAQDDQEKNFDEIEAWLAERRLMEL